MAAACTVLHPDGSEAAFSPVYGKGLYGPWAVSVDGNDNIWVSNFTGSQAGDRATLRLPNRELPAGNEDRRRDFAPGRLCRRRLAVAGRHRHRAGGRCLGHQQLARSRRLASASPEESASTRCAGEGVVVFFGMAKPVRDAADRAGAWALARPKARQQEAGRMREHTRSTDRHLMTLGRINHE